jgi:hypothetical protein
VNFQPGLQNVKGLVAEIIASKAEFREVDEGTGSQRQKTRIVSIRELFEMGIEIEQNLIGGEETRLFGKPPLIDFANNADRNISLETWKMIGIKNFVKLRLRELDGEMFINGFLGENSK